VHFLGVESTTSTTSNASDAFTVLSSSAEPPAVGTLQQLQQPEQENEKKNTDVGTCVASVAAASASTSSSSRVGVFESIEYSDPTSDNPGVIFRVPEAVIGTEQMTKLTRFMKVVLLVCNLKQRPNSDDVVLMIESTSSNQKTSEGDKDDQTSTTGKKKEDRGRVNISDDEDDPMNAKETVPVVIDVQLPKIAPYPVRAVDDYGVALLGLGLLVKVPSTVTKDSIIWIDVEKERYLRSF
jgi:hypothetical protein